MSMGVEPVGPGFCSYQMQDFEQNWISYWQNEVINMCYLGK